MARWIPLAHNHVALVDDADYDWLSQYKWNYVPSRNTGYAYGIIDGKPISMHRAIMQPPASLTVDHKNGNGIDNRRGNLRLATMAQQAQNSGVRSNSTSCYKGVRRIRCWWEARIRVNGEMLYLGHFRDPADAARAYDKAARQHFGEFAWLNFPREWQG